MKITIVTYNWPPRNAVGTHRPYSWAKYWSNAGANITVLTSKKKAFDSPLDLELTKIPNVEVVEVSYGKIASDLSFIWKVRKIRKLASMVKSWIRSKINKDIDPRQAWYKSAKNKAIEIAKESDVVISTSGPFEAHLIANEMKITNEQLFWIADYRDLWSDSYVTKLPKRLSEKRAKEELATVGRRADFLTAVSKDMVERLKTFLCLPAKYFPNGFDFEESSVRELVNARGPLNCPFRIVYTGTVYDGYQDPTPLLDALAELNECGSICDGEVTVDFYGSRLGNVTELVKNKRYKKIIRLMGHVSRREAIDAQRNSDILLLLESSSVKAKGVLTGKIFEYISSGRPILCVGGLESHEIGRVLQATGTGLTLSPKDYTRLPNIVHNTIRGRGLFDKYNPCLDTILYFSREKIAMDMYRLIKEEVDGRLG